MYIGTREREWKVREINMDEKNLNRIKAKNKQKSQKKERKERG